MHSEESVRRILTLERPHPSLWKYYIIGALLTGPGLVVMLPYLYFRYYTLRYRFDDEGIHMKVGILFRQEVNLTYARIQDIHLHSNFIQRWLGLANIQVQTASGSSEADLVIEGFKEFEAIRDYLYTRMRGYKDPHKPAARSSTAGTTPPVALGEVSEAVSLLMSIRDELRRTRELIEKRDTQPGATPPPQRPHV